MGKIRICVVISKLRCSVYIKEDQVRGKVLGNLEVIIFQKLRKVSGKKVEETFHLEGVF